MKKPMDSLTQFQVLTPCKMSLKLLFFLSQVCAAPDSAGLGCNSQVHKSQQASTAFQRIGTSHILCSLCFFFCTRPLRSGTVWCFTQSNHIKIYLLCTLTQTCWSLFIIFFLGQIFLSIYSSSNSHGWKHVHVFGCQSVQPIHDKILRKYCCTGEVL